eukprot:451671_1
MTNHYIIRLSLISILFLIQNTTCTLVISRPANGTGPIDISYEDIADSYYNQDRLLFVFNRSCIDNYHDSQDTDRIEEHVEQIRSTYAHCIALTNNTLNITHYDTRSYSYVFFDLFCSVYSMKHGSLSNSSINYDDLCIEYITYEPLFDTFIETVPSATPSFACLRQGTTYYKSYGMDLLDSVEMDNTYSFPQFMNESISDRRRIDLHILDSGVQSNHVEFRSHQVIHVMGDGPTIYENQYGDHGTHVAGIAGGINYDYRVCQYNEDGSQMPCYGNLIFNALLKAYIHIKETGKPKTTALEDAYHDYFADLISVGGVPVCTTSPAYSSNAITVGSYDRSGYKSGFSNYGQCVDVWAPGTSIYSAIASNKDNKYEYKQGTSMASPYIAGVVANVLYINPDLSFEDVKAVLLMNAQPVSGDECDEYECKRAQYTCQSSLVYDLPSELEPYEIILIVLAIVFFICIVVMCVTWCIKKQKETKFDQQRDENWRGQYNQDEYNQQHNVRKEGCSAQIMYDAL